MEVPTVVSAIVETELSSYEITGHVLEGDIHREFEVVDEAGDQYVLKVAGDTEEERARVKHEAVVVGSLQEFDFVPDLCGSGVVDSYPFLLFDRVEATEQWGTARWETTAARTLGETLARVHTDIEPRAEWRTSGDAHPLPESQPPAATFETLCELRTSDRRRLAELLPDVAAVLQETTAERGVVHGDVTIDNVRFSSDARECTLVDWETATVADAYFDVAIAELRTFQLFSSLLSVPEETILSELRAAYGVPSSAVRRIRAHKILQLCRMVPRVERLGPYASWQRRVDGSCLEQVERVLERTVRRCTFAEPLEGLGTRGSGDSEE
ncbi:aminoglycoside phosphotransferase [Halobiforma lacisalsi AJ5]|uniref:Aminoglycoside phosphotransferase n=1 Tax=Natronobacterium lacisalsi AJ5 TaxID=358396 RepID=M0L4J9_NATLA|nr:aminoglycoside phosphotransferase family protein [Halobiforma lacisalsi]APW96357.1 aminoglycoside phosphotransferase [Halobiforma lacisalsi AJ5]EMA27369.1 aminoglycoside phosphotransferase [Halobiforma lacisalsi AJ5]